MESNNPTRRELLGGITATGSLVLAGCVGGGDGDEGGAGANGDDGTENNGGASDDGMDEDDDGSGDGDTENGDDGSGDGDTENRDDGSGDGDTENGDDGMDNDGSDGAMNGEPTVRITGTEEYGDVLVGPDGLSLYMFDSDERGAGESTCYDGCAENWPPLTVEDDPVAGDGVGAELTTFEREDGSMQVAADGWPLYYFANDEAAGDTNGQGLNDVWWVLEPDGTPVRGDGGDGGSGDGDGGDDSGGNGSEDGDSGDDDGDDGDDGGNGGGYGGDY